MSCSKCKKRDRIKQEIEDGLGSVNKGVIWGIVIWTIFAVYGIYSLITDLL